MYNDRYTSGVNAVKANPSSYGITTGGVSSLVVKGNCSNPNPNKYTLYAMITYHHTGGGRPHFLGTSGIFGGLWVGMSDAQINATFPPSDYNLYMYGPK